MLLITMVLALLFGGLTLFFRTRSS